MQAKDVFKEMVNLCYEEDFPELHKEILSLEFETKKNKDTYKFQKAMEDLLSIVPLFAEDFPNEALLEIERIHNEFLENGE